MWNRGWGHVAAKVANCSGIGITAALLVGRYSFLQVGLRRWGHDTCAGPLVASRMASLQAGDVAGYIRFLAHGRTAVPADWQGQPGSEASRLVHRLLCVKVERVDKIKNVCCRKNVFLPDVEIFSPGRESQCSRLM